ncbi:MAG: NUDIX hydrolase [archaeon]
MAFKNPGSTVDIIVEREGKILLVKRKNPPYKGMWAIPGGFIEYGKETLEQAAKRELKEETCLDALKLELMGVYSEPKRDPRGHVISHVYAAKTRGTAKASDDAKELQFFPLSNLPALAFDHKKIISDYQIWREK